MTEENITNTTETTAELTAGEMLRNARTMGRRKREIQTVAKQLCIREEFLQALEDGNYTFIPEVVYILGFARNYAMELGLDPDEIVAKIKRELGLVPDDSNAAGDEEIRIDTRGKSVRANFLVRARDYVMHNWKWFACGFAALVIIIVALLLVLNRGAGDAAVAPGADAAIVAVGDIAEPEYTHPVRERFGIENRETANVILQAVQESWVKIEDARGKSVFSRVLVPGDVYFVPAGDKYKGTFGNAGGIQAWVNGELVPALGADHTRVTGISMAPDSLVQSAESAQ